MIMNKYQSNLFQATLMSLQYFTSMNNKTLPVSVLLFSTRSAKNLSFIEF